MPRLRREPARSRKTAKSATSSERMLPGQGKMRPKDERQAEDVACPSRGPHDGDCLCKGTGKIKAIGHKSGRTDR